MTSACAQNSLTKVNITKLFMGPQTSIRRFPCTILPAIISFQTAASGLVADQGRHSLKERLATHGVFQRPPRSMPRTKWAFKKCHLLTLKSPRGKKGRVSRESRLNILCSVQGILKCNTNNNATIMHPLLDLRKRYAQTILRKQPDMGVSGEESGK